MRPERSECSRTQSTALCKINQSINQSINRLSVCSENAPSPRKELLHNIDILYKQSGPRLYPDTFDTRTRAAIRLGDYKLITGNPGRVS